MTPKTARVLGVLALAGAAADALFWVLVVVGVTKFEGETATFESAFPIADAVMGVILVMAGTSLLRGRPSGTFLLTIGASMALYLGILDVTFYARQGAYALNGAMLGQVVVNVMCIAGGAAGLFYVWRGVWRVWRAA